MAAGCNTTKYLGEGEHFLKENEIKFVTAEKTRDVKLLEYEIESLIEQEPNSRYLFVPARYYYYKHNSPSDTSWYDNFINKNIAEIPAVFSEEATVATATNIQQYLTNKKGYYDAMVTYDTAIRGDFVEVTYKVDLGRAYRTRSMIFIGDDDEVIRILAATKDESAIRIGNPLDALDFDVERQRIITLMQNNGYADFNNNYIQIKGDSTEFDREVEVFIEIENPQGSSKHQKYTIGKINVFTDFDQTKLIQEPVADSTMVNDRMFYRSSDRFLVRPEIVNRNIFVQSGNLYSRDAYNQTVQALGRLSTYKFVRINAVVSEEDPNIIDYNILLTPHVYKWSMDLGNDVFFSTVAVASQNQLGLSANGSLLGRNFFGGAETYRLNADAGWEFQFGIPLQTNAISLGLQNELTIPRIVDLTRTFKLLNSTKLLSDDRYRNIRRNGNTAVSLGARFQSLRGSFDLTSITGSYGFDIQSNNHRTVFKQLGIGLFIYDTTPAFDSLIMDSPLIQRSLDDNLFSGFLFNELSYFWSQPTNAFGVSSKISTSLEISGIETAILNRLITPNTPWNVNGIDFANFAKFSFDYRWYRQVNDRNMIAFRSFAGIAVPYFDDDAVPFIKQFFVGGPNSIRGWQPRELGPGAFEDPDVTTTGSFFQTGDIKLEFNLEYRTDLFYWVEGALFVDAGNVWALSRDINRPNIQFGPDFITQIAVGIGYGLRFNFFEGFVFRLDFGYKLLSPFEINQTGSRFVDIPEQRLGNVNVAINYPF